MLDAYLQLGIPLASLNSYPDRVDAVDSTALQNVLTDCRGHEAISVVGATQASLDGLEVDWVDWKARAAAEAKAVR